jgi:hypothetical protein
VPKGVAVSPDGRSSTYTYGADGPDLTAAKLVDRALERMSDQLDPFAAAGTLIRRWVEQDNSLQPLLAAAIDDLEAREARSQKQIARSKRVPKGPAPRVGDFALMVSGFGPTFFVVTKVNRDPKGKLTSLTLSGPGTGEVGPAVAINRIAAVFANILTTQE